MWSVLMSGKFVQAVANIAKTAFTHAPKHVQNAISDNASLLNTPDLGVDGNYAYGAAQLNIAPAQEDTPGAFPYTLVRSKVLMWICSRVSRRIYGQLRSTTH